MSTLTLSQDGGGRRHFVDGKPVHCGTGLQWSPDYGNTWINVRYECHGDFRPVLYLPDGGRMEPGVDSRFRWPSGSGCHSMTRSARPIKIKVLPDEVLKKLEARRGHYSDMVSVYHAVLFDEATTAWLVTAATAATNGSSTRREADWKPRTAATVTRMSR